MTLHQAEAIPEELREAVARALYAKHGGVPEHFAITAWHVREIYLEDADAAIRAVLAWQEK